MSKNAQSAPLGYRDPMTYRKADTITAMVLNSHVMNMEMLVGANDNVAKHQYMYELMSGEDPRQSEWFKRGYDGWVQRYRDRHLRY